MATYVNDLRLKEIATGDESGTWGASTNTNLELIAEAFSFGTEAITTNADTHTTTIADGSTDPGRSLFLKYTGTLDSACTITIGPNTVSKLWLIENATSGSQNIIIKQGSGATVTIANGQTKAIYSDGAGSGGAMVDAFQDLSIPDLFIDDDLTFTSDSAVITFGADGDTTLTHTDGSGLTLNSTNKLMFNDASQFIQGSSATVLSLGATDEIDLTATAIDVNGTIDVSGNATLGGTLGVTGAVTANAGVVVDNITIDGQEIDVSSGDLTLDVAGDIHIDAAGGQINFKDSGTTRVTFELDATPEVSFTGGNLAFNNLTADADIAFKGFDASSFITALTLDMSNAGAALFNGAVTTGDTITVNSGSLNLASDGGTLFIGADIDMRLTHDGSNGTFRCDTGDMTFDVAGDIVFDADGGDFNFKDGGTTLLSLSNAGSNNVQLSTSISDGDLLFKGNDGGSIITALTLDMSAAGRAIFGADADMSDGNAFRFGDSQDLLIYHSSNENIIQANTTDQDLIFKGVDGGSSITALTLDMSEGGAATFRGNMTMNGIAGTSPILNLVNNDTEDVNTGRESSVRFNGFRSGGEAVINSQISGNHTSSADDDKGGLFFYTNGGSGLGERMRITSDEIIINDDGGDQNFRIETDAQASAFVVDAGAEKITMAVPLHLGDLIASGSGGLALQTDDGVKRITLEDSGTITLGNNSLAAASTLNARRTGATGDILRLSGGNSNVGEFAVILIHGEDVTGGQQKGIITFNTIDVANVGDATLQERVRVTAEGPTRFVSGSSTVPGITFLNDTNTGFNNASADNIGFVVGGSQKAFLSASQFNVTGNGVFSGSISKGSGSFKIDHPLPSKTDTHHLVHSFVEAPQADNIYRGSVDLVGGSATVNIDTAAGMTDGTFVLLNTNVQCFTSNESGWTAIKGSVSGNTLTITAQDSDCTDTISWMVVGERHDQHMKDTEWTDSDGKVIVEPKKVYEGE